MSNVILKNVSGVSFYTFLEKYEPKIKDKHIFYVVASNLEQDLDIPGRGRIVKVGRSLGTIKKRISEYVNHFGAEMKSNTDQGGLNILYLRTFPKRLPMMTGQHILEIYEKQIKDLLKEKYGHITYRGDERFRVNVPELFKILDNFKPDLSQSKSEFVRRSEKIGGERLVWITKDENGKLYLNFHDQFKEIMDLYFKDNSKVLEKLGITDGMIKSNTEDTILLDTISRGTIQAPTRTSRIENINEKDDGETTVDNFDNAGSVAGSVAGSPMTAQNIANLIDNINLTPELPHTPVSPQILNRIHRLGLTPHRYMTRIQTQQQQSFTRSGLRYNQLPDLNPRL